MKRFWSVKPFLSLSATLLFVSVTWANMQKKLEPIGPHFEIFRFEKSENPENILVVYTRLTEKCEFVSADENSEKPVFDFYWLMNRTTYKPVHPLIKLGIHERLQMLLPADFSQHRNSFAVQVNDLKDINPSLVGILVEIRANLIGSHCELQSSVNFPDDSKDSLAIILDKIYVESEKAALPPFRKVISIRFEGKNKKTGRFERKIFVEKPN